VRCRASTTRREHRAAFTPWDFVEQPPQNLVDFRNRVTECARAHGETRNG
jgi:hypothetical protein